MNCLVKPATELSSDAIPCINLDAMSPQELLEVASAKTLVPYQRLYAHCKYVAMTLRIGGSIQTALLAERVCESIYNLLPLELRW